MSDIQAWYRRYVATVRQALLMACIGVGIAASAGAALPAEPVYAFATSTTYYVAAAPTGNDSNDCLSAASPCATIVTALAKAAVGSTINIAPGTFYEHISLTKDVMLIGAGAGQTIIDGSYNGTAITIQIGATATISGVTIQHGTSFSAGGGIVNNGMLALTNSVVDSNTATGLSGGTAPYNSGSSSGTTGGRAGSGIGGGIYNTSTMTVTNSTISRNAANGGHGGDGGIGVMNGGTGGAGGDGSGGGIYNTGALTLDNSAIISNSVTGGIGGDGGFTGCGCNTGWGGTGGIGSGGGLYNGGMLSLTKITVAGNTAFGGHGGNSPYYGGAGGSGGDGIGGGIYDVGSISVGQTTISRNTAFGGSGGSFYYSGHGGTNGVGSGGGISISGTHSASISDTILAANSALTAPDCEGALASLGYNFLGVDSACSGFINGVNGDQVGTLNHPLDPLLGSLKDNGGPVWTMAPQPGSPVISSGDPHNCQTNSGSCNIGAYVSQPLTSGGDMGSSDGTTTPELSSGELVATGMLPILSVLLYRRRWCRAQQGKNAH